MKYAMLLMYSTFAAFGFWGATGSHFYGGGVGKKATQNPVPTWFGRLWYILFALGATFMGVKSLLALHH